MLTFVARALISALALLIVAWLGIGVSVSGLWAALLGAVILAVANGVLRPILLLLTLPINVLTLGLFTFVVNALIFWLVLSVVPGLGVRGFWPALLGSVMVGLLTWIGTALAGV